MKWPLLQRGEDGPAESISKHAQALLKHRSPCRRFCLTRAIQQAVDNLLAMSQGLFSGRKTTEGRLWKYGKSRGQRDRARAPALLPFGSGPDIRFGKEINNVAAMSDLICHSPSINVAMCKNYLSAAMTCVRLAWWDRKSG